MRYFKKGDGVIGTQFNERTKLKLDIRRFENYKDSDFNYNYDPIQKIKRRKFSEPFSDSEEEEVDYSLEYNLDEEEKFDP